MGLEHDAAFSARGVNGAIQPQYLIAEDQDR
jgi:hypothetical protein